MLSHRRVLQTRAFVAALFLLVLSLFPQFDAATPGLSWDAVHFFHVARNGFVYEHEWAWFPALPALVSLSPFAPTILALALAWDSTKTLYALSLHHLQSPALARLATLLSLLPSSPATLFVAPYTEAFFTYFSYKGMLFCARSRYPLAALAFTAAGMFRSNGFVLSGFIIWDLLVAPLVHRKKVRLPTLPASVLIVVDPALRNTKVPRLGLIAVHPVRGAQLRRLYRLLRRLTITLVV
uniref:GPI mannosyltransferase 2 n=1 Tax=Mycena chlorophos TaxID=658473 RepID=A0ABQ0M323_MYCCL|nr:glycosyltransferase family 76 protein [Mycena chlorophos]